MKRCVGTVVRGIRTPILQKGDEIVDFVVDSLSQAIQAEDIKVRDHDIVAITESLLARAQDNHATIDQIATDIKEKFPSDIGVVFPILSRNRFAQLLEGIAKSGRKLHILLSYPADEVGNALMDVETLRANDINPYTDLLEEKEYRQLFGKTFEHKFTKIDYVNLYKKIAPQAEVYFSNDPTDILKYCQDVLVCSIHTREDVKAAIKVKSSGQVLGLDDILTEAVNGSGYNPQYGLLGSNASNKKTVKLFPRDSQAFVEEVQRVLVEKFGKQIEVMVYGDGAFKDPVGHIWELADPVVSPGYTAGLEGTPDEIKIKYIADSMAKDSKAHDVQKEIEERLVDKSKRQQEDSLGTTPRQITDLLGSLSDLTSGSGDKGTPVVYIQGYFDTYADGYED